MNRTLMLQALGAMTLGALVALTAGCGDQSTGGAAITPSDRLDWTATAQLALADSCGEAETYFHQAAITAMELELDQNRRCFSGDGCYRWLAGGMEDSVQAPPSGEAANDDAVPDDFSETNVQVEGVDEADIVKTDGQHVVTLFGADLVILKSWPAAETAEIGRVRVKGAPTSFYVKDGLAVVLSYANYYDFLPPALREDPHATGDAIDSSWRWRGATLVTLVDISDPAAPAVTTEHLFDGYSLATRRIDDKVYLAQTSYSWIDGLSTWPNDLDWDAPDDVVDARFEALRQQNVALIEATPLSHWLGHRYLLGPDGTFDPAAAEAVTSCNAVYAPSVYSGQNVLSVLTLDLAEPDPTQAITGSSIIGDWGNVYASADSIYIGATNWSYYWWWEDTSSVQPLTTHIHQFAIGTDGVARYVASGSVLGYAINQYAFDEYDGHLRVATTDGFGWWNSGDTTESRVTVLARQGTHLVQQGLVTGLGEGESIYAVRFIGPEGYVVTFRQVDPLYSLDLSDPTNPHVTGELKISGYSSYMHPLDDDHLLTIGRDADDEGRVQGLQFQIFDVSDPAAPTLAHKTTLGADWSTWSEAEWDPHAFVYYASRGLLAVPVSGWEPNDAQGYWHYRSEVFLFRVSLDDGVSLVGSVSHVPFLEALDVNTTCHDWYGWWEARVRRGVFIEDYLVTLSNLGFMVHDTRNFAAGAVAADICIDPADFNGGQSYYDPCYEAQD
jgi:hypothetical protein